MENCILCGSHEFSRIGQQSPIDLYFDYSCSYCGKFRIDGLSNDYIRSDSFKDKAKVSSFLHSKKEEGIKMVIISGVGTAYSDDLKEAIDKGEVLDLFLDDIS